MAPSAQQVLRQQEVRSFAFLEASMEGSGRPLEEEPGRPHLPAFTCHGLFSLQA